MPDVIWRVCVKVGDEMLTERYFANFKAAAIFAEDAGYSLSSIINNSIPERTGGDDWVCYKMAGGRAEVFAAFVTLEGSE